MEEPDSAIKNKVACAFEADSSSAVPPHLLKVWEGWGEIVWLEIIDTYWKKWLKTKTKAF